MIELRAVTKRFGGCVAVDRVSFRVEPGQIFALLGPNGGGKTTILKCMAGLVTPTAGDVFIGGTRAGMPAAKLSMSYLPQQVAFPDSLTAGEVLDFYSRLRKLPAGKMQSALQNSNLNGFSGKQLREFSGGMLQRLGLAVALLPDVPVLLLDEPTAGLDPEVVLEFRRGLARIRDQGRTIVLASHDLHEVEEVADRVAILVAGKLIVVETVLALREQMASVSSMVITVQNAGPELLAVAGNAGARSAAFIDHTLVVSCSADRRLSILHALEAAGACIESFSTREPSLEELYLRYVNENTTGSRSAGGSADHKLSGGKTASGCN